MRQITALRVTSVMGISEHLEEPMKRLLPILAALSALAVGCGKDDCEDGYYECDGDVLLVCDGGELIEDEDCAASEMICHAMGGGDDHCMEEGAMDM